MKKIIFGILASFVALIGLVSAQSYNGCNMAGMMYGSYGSGIMLFSWLIGLAILVALVLFIVWLIKQVQKK